MKHYKNFLKLFATIISFNISYAQNSIDFALTFVDSLKANSPKIHGIPLNDYLISDLNHDGTYEVIERINSIENKSPGLLSYELSLAFDFDKIYIYDIKSKCYQLNYKQNKNYLIKKKHFYEFWLKQINNPIHLNYDSQELIKVNKEYFILELTKLIKLLDANE